MTVSEYWPPSPRDLVFVAVPLLIVFSQQLSIAELQQVTEFASINTEDLAVLLVGALYLSDELQDDEPELRLSLPHLTAVFVVVTTWIVVSTTVNLIRLDVSILASYLWIVKWIEVVVFFLVLQHVATRRSALYGVVTLLGAGVVLAGATILVTLGDASRVGLTFENPNVLGSFLLLIATVAVATTIAARRPVVRAAAAVATALAVAALLATESRSAMLGLVVAVPILLVLLRDRLSTIQLGGMGLAGAAALGAMPFVVGRDGIERLVGWVSIGPGGIALTDTPAARSFEIRAGLVERGFGLLAEAPVFGHGWFAAPTRIGWLDVHHVTLLAELGLVGFLLFGILYLWILRSFVGVTRGHLALGSAGVAWYVGLQVQSAGGPFPRIPQILFVTTFFLVCAWTLARPTAGDQTASSSAAAKAAA